MRCISNLICLLIIAFPLRSPAQTAKGRPYPDSSPTVQNSEKKPAARQKAAEPLARYHRYIALVRLVGTGRPGDPIRPEYAPAAIDANRTGIISWSMQPTDNKNFAIAHFVAVDRKAFDSLDRDKGARSDIKVFEIGKDKPEDIEKALRPHKKDFVLADLQAVAQ